MTNELKPCPFCGSEAHIYRHPTIGNYAPACNNDRCEVYWQREYGTEAEAIAAWNTRAEPQKVAVANVTFTQEQIDEIKEYCLRNLSRYTPVEVVD